MTIRKVRKAVFPVAGLGTRLLPATKSTPKEMLTIVDKPLIQYAVEEARAAGIEQMIFVTGRGKGALEDHFDIGFELETVMRGRGKSLHALEAARTGFGEIVSVRQQQPLGLGHAVWCARPPMRGGSCRDRAWSSLARSRCRNDPRARPCRGR